MLGGDGHACGFIAAMPEQKVLRDEFETDRAVLHRPQ